MINIELYDYLGKQIEVHNFELNKFELDISHLSPGMYFVKIKQGERLSTARIVKE